MATTITEANYWTLTLATTTTPVYNFKFVVDMYIGGAKVIRIKQPRNAGSVAHLDYEKLLKNYLSTTNLTATPPDITNAFVTTEYDSVHLMPLNKTNPTGSTIVDKPMSINDGTLIEVTFKFYEEYSTTATGTISITGSTTATDWVAAKINYANEWIDRRTLLASKFDMRSASILSRFLSKLPYETTKPNDTLGLIPHLTAYDDYRTFSWLNEYSTYFGTVGGFILITYFTETPKYEDGYKAINPAGYTWIYNHSDNGGVVPSSATSEEEYLLFCGVGAGNLKNVNYNDYGGYQLQEGNGIKYYTVNYASLSTATTIEAATDLTKIKQGMYVEIVTAGTTDWTLYGSANNTIGTRFWSDTDGNAITGNGTYKHLFNIPRSEMYLFEIAADENNNSTKNEGFTLAWKNKFGTWDYHYFDGASSKSSSFKRAEKYTRNAGTWNAATLTFGDYERGTNESVEGKNQIKLNTRYLNDDYNDYFEGLAMSNDVMIIDTNIKVGSNLPDANTENLPFSWVQPVNLKDRSINYKTNVKDKLVQYSFTVEYANELKTQF